MSNAMKLARNAARTQGVLARQARIAQAKQPKQKKFKINVTVSGVNAAPMSVGAGAGVQTVTTFPINPNSIGPSNEPRKRSAFHVVVRDHQGTYTWDFKGWEEFQVFLNIAGLPSEMHPDTVENAMDFAYHVDSLQTRGYVTKQCELSVYGQSFVSDLFFETTMQDTFKDPSAVKRYMPNFSGDWAEKCCPWLLELSNEMYRNKHRRKHFATFGSLSIL